MELRHLRYFVAVAQEGSIARAAERLNIQPPPLGQQIRMLEMELGVTLFDRKPKKIALNPAGRVFLEEARAVLLRSEEAIDSVRRFNQGESGLLNVGFTSSASLHRVTPHILRHFRSRYPKVEIEVEERETYELVLALQQKRIDVALLHISSEGFDDLSHSIVAEIDLVAAIPVDHPLADPAIAVISLAMIANEPLVVYRRLDGPGIFDTIGRAYAREDQQIRVADQVSRLIAAINLVAAGRGISIVPRTMEVLHRESIVYKPISKQWLAPLPLYGMYRSGEWVRLVQNFIAELNANFGLDGQP